VKGKSEKLKLYKLVGKKLEEDKEDGGNYIEKLQ